MARRSACQTLVSLGSGIHFYPLRRGWPTTSSSSKSGEEYAGRRGRRADAPRQQKSSAAGFAACRSVEQQPESYCWPEQALGAYRQSRNISLRLRLGRPGCSHVLMLPGPDRVLAPKPPRDTMRYYANTTCQRLRSTAQVQYVAQAASTPCHERLGRAAAQLSRPPPVKHNVQSRFAAAWLSTLPNSLYLGATPGD